ncbi:MAG: putative zinc-binding protein [Bacteriovoracaceae bacterium]
MKMKEVVVYSCSGCSNVAQLANNIAVKMQRNHIAKMSCIAGIGGDVRAILKIAQNAEMILALDGCPLQCAKNCLKRHNFKIDAHLVLTEYGLSKNTNEDVSSESFEKVYNETCHIVEELKNSK